jgi:hypothetical protein
MRLTSGKANTEQRRATQNNDRKRRSATQRATRSPGQSNPLPRAEAIRWARPGSSATLRGRDDHTGRATSQPVTQTAHRGHSTRGLTRPNLPELRALTLRISMRILDGSFDGGSVGPMGSWCCRTARVRFASVQPYVPIRPASGNVVM